MKPILTTSRDLLSGGDMQKLLPPWDDIPETFRRGDTKWNRIVSRWLVSGLPEGTLFLPEEGVDWLDAVDHIRAIFSSIESTREHKQAGAAYLMSVWFYDIRTPGEAV